MGGVFRFHSTWILSVLILLGNLPTSPVIGCKNPPDKEKQIKVKVVVIIATKKNKKIDPLLKWIAHVVQKRHPELTGFRVARRISKSLPLAGSETFEVAINQKATITVLKEVGKENRIQLKVDPPTLGPITYTTCCGKFFPIITRHEPKPKELLILAICVDPCKKK